MIDSNAAHARPQSSRSGGCQILVIALLSTWVQAQATSKPDDDVRRRDDRLKIAGEVWAGRSPLGPFLDSYPPSSDPFVARFLSTLLFHGRAELRTEAALRSNALVAPYHRELVLDALDAESDSTAKAALRRLALRRPVSARACELLRSGIDDALAADEESRLRLYFSEAHGENARRFASVFPGTNREGGNGMSNDATSWPLRGVAASSVWLDLPLEKTGDLLLLGYRLVDSKQPAKVLLRVGDVDFESTLQPEDGPYDPPIRVAVFYSERGVKAVDSVRLEVDPSAIGALQLHGLVVTDRKVRPNVAFHMDVISPNDARLDPGDGIVLTEHFLAVLELGGKVGSLAIDGVQLSPDAEWSFDHHCDDPAAATFDVFAGKSLVARVISRPESRSATLRLESTAAKDRKLALEFRRVEGKGTLVIERFRRRASPRR